MFDGKLRVVDDYPDPCPRADEVVVKVLQAGICATDLEIVRGYMDFRGVFGHEFVGTVVGGRGDLLGSRVVGEINCICHRCDMCRAGLGNHCRNRTVLGISGRDGAFAELLAVPGENLHVVPPQVSDDQAVFVEPLAAALQVASQYSFDCAQRVAVLGPGRLGLLVGQVLRPMVGELTLFGRSSAAATLCERLGLVLDVVDGSAGGADFDVVVDCTGTAGGLDLAQKLVRPRGTIILKSTYAGSAGPNLALTVINEVQIIGSRCGPFDKAIEYLRNDTVRVEPLIGGRYPLSNGVDAIDAASQPGSLKILLRMCE